MANGAEAPALLRQAVTAMHRLQRPAPGERAEGYDVSGAIVAVPCLQPLAAADIWRVSLADEICVRLVGRGHNGVWRLLQLDDLTDAQLDTYEAIMEGLGVTSALSAG